MVLVDTSLWIKHFSHSKSELTDYLLKGEVVIHELILGELTLGQFSPSDRLDIFTRLSVLEKLPTSPHDEVVKFVTENRLYGKGVGWIDCHLLHASLMARVPLLTLDKNLSKLKNSYF